MAKKKRKVNGIVVDTSNGYIRQDEYFKNKNNLNNQLVSIGTKPLANDDIAPIKSKKSSNDKKENKEWWEKIIETPEAFEDGIDILEIPGTVLGSLADAGLNVAGGIVKTGENIAQVGAGLLAEGIDLFAGENEYTKGIRRKISGAEGNMPISGAIDWLKDKVEDYSIFGETGDNIFNGIGYTMGMFEGGKILPNNGNISLQVGEHIARLPVLSAIGGTSSGLQEAYSKGATGVQAWEKALGSGAIESITESMFGFMGIGGNDVTDEFAKKFTNKFTSGVAQSLVKLGVSSTAEGLEEVISSTANQFLDKAIDRFSKDDDPKFYEKLNPSELVEEFVTTFLSTALQGGYNSVVDTQRLSNNAINNMEKEAGRQLSSEEKANVRDQVLRALTNDNTLNEQKVADYELNSRLSQLENATSKDRAKLRFEINQDIQNGRISIDSIKNSVGDMTEQWNSQYNQLQELRQEIETSDNEAEKKYLKKQYNQLLKEYNQDDNLRKSYVEEANKSSDFSYSLDENTSELAKVTYESTKELNLNNTKTTHDTVDFASKLAEYTGRSIKFTNNEHLKEMGLIVDGKTTNGVYKGEDNSIYINIDSPKAIMSTIGHEVGHLLDNESEGEKLRKFAVKYAQTKGEYGSRMETLQKNYADVKNANLEVELTNDIIGDYLFNDDTFVEQFAMESPSTFKKIYNWFKHVFNIATKGSKEARQLENIRYNLEKGLAKINEKNKSNNVLTNENKKTSYSIKMNKDGKKYVEIDTNQDIFEGRSLKEQNKIAKQYILDNFRENGLLIDQNQVEVTSTTARKYTNPTERISKENKSIKNRASTELDNLLKISRKIGESKDEKKHTFARDGWEYYKTIFHINNSYFEGIINIGKSGEYRTLYDINNIKKTSLNSNLDKSNAVSKETSFMDKIIPQNSQNVNDSTKYSMQEGQNDTQNTDSSNPLSSKIDYFNNYLKDNNIQIPTIKDIYNSFDDYEVTDNSNFGKTISQIEDEYFQEISNYLDSRGVALKDESLDSMVSTKKDGRKQIKQEDIKFTDEDLEAVFGKQVNEDYESAMEEAEKYKYSLSDSGKTTDNNGNMLTKKQFEYFKNSKATNKKGELETVYHTTTDETRQFNIFNPVGTDHYRFGDQVVNYYTNSKEMSGSYADQHYEMADTKKITTMKEIKNYIQEYNKLYEDQGRKVELRKVGNSYELVDNRFIPQLNKTSLEVYNEANEFKKTLTEKELKQFRDMFNNSSSYMDFLEGYNIDRYLKRKGYEYGSIEDIIAQKYLQIFENVNYEQSGIFKDAVFRDAKYRRVGKFDTKEELLRNVKTKLSIDDNSRKQYKGYVNIINPYVSDAEGRNWNRIESKENNRTKALNEMTDSTKDKLIKLANKSIDKYNKAQQNREKWSDIEDSIYHYGTLEQKLFVNAVRNFNIEDIEEVLKKSTTKPDYTIKERLLSALKSEELLTLEEMDNAEFDEKALQQVKDKVTRLLDSSFDNNTVSNKGTYTIREVLANLEKARNTEFDREWSYFDNELIDNDLKYRDEEDVWKLPTMEFGNRIINEENVKTLFNVSKAKFDSEFILDRYGEKNTTNDIVKSVLEMNKKGYDYDGVIIKNVVDYGGDSKTHKSADLFVTFNSNQFKSVDNTTPTEDQDIRYSVNNEEDIAPVKETLTKTLPKSYEPFLEFAKENNLLSEDEKMIIFNGIDREDKPSIDKKIVEKKIEYPPQKKVMPEKSNWKKTIDTLDYLFVNRNSEIDNLAKDSGNMNIKYYGDMLNGVSGEATGEITTAQTNNKGEAIGKSVNELFEWADYEGLSDIFNDYLLHYSNIDRHEQGVGSRVKKETSERKVKEYERQYPQLKAHAEEVWNFSKNVRNNLLDAGIINESLHKSLGEMYPHYVPYMEKRDITQYIDDTGVLKPVSVLKTAKGKATHKALTPVQEALSKYIYNEKKQIRQNDLYREIYNTLDGEKMLIGTDEEVGKLNDNDMGLYQDETGNYLKAIFNGETNAIRISDDLYNQLNKKMERHIKDLEQSLELITTPVQKLSNIRRNLLTTWSPSFILKNPIKDFGDAVINSTDTKAFMKNYLPAYFELSDKNNSLANQFKTLYGSGNAMGEYESDSGLSTGKKVLNKGKGIFQRISNFNEIVELAPRYAEFKSTLERGGSVQEAMYNAREVTINFNRGGVVTKALNRNGFTFLNASVQGFDKFIRNFSGQNGAIGIVGALAKATVYGVMPALFNHLIYTGGDEPDEEYENFPDYIKDNYYLIKMENGNWLRIPKGRIPAVFGMVGRRTLEFAQGDKDAFEGMVSSIYSQVGVNNPSDNNILAPIKQAYFSGENGEAWYGGDLVPSRLQDKPAGEQYDESTDTISKWIGSKFGISPYKFNYVIEQYTGGIGDIVLPMITEEASSDAETIPEYMIAPLKDQFFINSTMDNRNASEFFTTKDELTVKSNSDYATDEDILKNKYMFSISSELSKLYAEKREIQSNSSLSKKQKYEKVKQIQDEINKLSKEGLENYQNLSKTENYAIVGNREYYKDGDEWKKVNSDELDELNLLGLDLNEKSDYFNSKNEISVLTKEYKETTENATDEEKTILNKQKKIEIIDIIKNSNLTDETKTYLYTKKYGDYNTVNALTNLGIKIDDYMDLESQEFTSDKYANGKTVTNSKKNKVIRYINSMSISGSQKVILAKLKYPSMNTYNQQIIRYIQSNGNLDYEEKLLLYKKLGFKVENGKISW